MTFLRVEDFATTTTDRGSMVSPVISASLSSKNASAPKSTIVANALTNEISKGDN